MLTKFKPITPGQRGTVLISKKELSNDLIPNGSDVLVKTRGETLGIAIFFEKNLKPKKVFSNTMN